MMKNKWVFFSTLLLLFSCEKKEPVEEPLRFVVVEKVSFTKDVPASYFSGFSKAEKEIDVSFRVSGQIEKLPIRVGDRVRKGQLIAQIDDTDYQLQYKEAESGLQEALAEKRRASAHYRRIKILFESDSASRNELDTARADYESSVANVEKGMASVDLSKKRLSYARIYVDNDHCEVSEKVAEIYENVLSGQTIAKLNCGILFEVEIAVPETEIANIQVGQKMDIQFNAISGKTFQGTVTEVGVSSDGAAYPVTISLDQTNTKLRAGMAAKAIIYRQEERLPTLVIPTSAVGEDEKGHFVYLFVSKSADVGIAQRQEVSVGEVTPSGFQITSGLKEGDLVIVKGLRFLRNGKEVRRQQGSK